MDPYGDPEYPHNLKNAVYISFPIYPEQSVGTFLSKVYNNQTNNKTDTKDK